MFDINFYKDVIEVIDDVGIALSEDTVCYFFQIEPINSVFTNDDQMIVLAESFEKKLAKINMPGQLIVRPNVISKARILDYQERLYQTYGHEVFHDLKESIVDSTRREFGKIKYNYSLYLMFTENREDFHEDLFKGIIKKRATKIDNVSKDIMQITYKKLRSILEDGLSLADVDIKSLMRYIALPTERQWDTFYYASKADHVEYKYQRNAKASMEDDRTIYARHLIVSKLPTGRTSPTPIFNKLQMLNYPVDIVVKFDPMVTKDFAKKMREKNYQIERDQKKFQKAKGYNNDQYRKESTLAKIGLQGENTSDEFKIRFQIMMRVYASQYELMLNRYAQLIKELGGNSEDDRSITVSYALGRQEKLMYNLNPFKITFRENVHTTDLNYLAYFNWFGGLKIGFENGYVFAYTKPADKVVLYDASAVIAGKTKHTAPVNLIAGESGSGKSQLANIKMLMNMIFYGMITLCIDPKGDRRKLYSLLPEESKALLVIGDSSDQRGLFDPFNIYESKDEAIEKAKSLLTVMHRILNPTVEVSLGEITKAYLNSEKLATDGYYKRTTMLTIVKELQGINELWGTNMVELSTSKYGYLFFADDKEAKKQTGFNLSKQFNLVMFHNPPNLDDFNPNDYDSQLFSLLLAETGTYVNQLMYKEDYDGLKQIIFDEWRIWKASPNGAQIVRKTANIARSMRTDITIIDQYFSNLDEFVENASSIFIGNVNSSKEVDHIIKEFKLSGNSTVRSVLEDTSGLEGVTLEQMYRFVYIDANNRKGVVKAKFPDILKDALDTKFKQKHDKELNQDEEDFIDDLAAM